MLTPCLESCPPEFSVSLVDGIDARITHCEFAIYLAELHFTRDFKYVPPSPHGPPSLTSIFILHTTPLVTPA